jgi:hypothetical protein
VYRDYGRHLAISNQRRIGQWRISVEPGALHDHLGYRQQNRTQVGDCISRQRPESLEAVASEQATNGGQDHVQNLGCSDHVGLYVLAVLAGAMLVTVDNY